METYQVVVYFEGNIIETFYVQSQNEYGAKREAMKEVEEFYIPRGLIVLKVVVL